MFFSYILFNISNLVLYYHKYKIITINVQKNKVLLTNTYFKSQLSKSYFFFFSYNINVYLFVLFFDTRGLDLNLWLICVRLICGLRGMSLRLNYKVNIKVPFWNLFFAFYALFKFFVSITSLSKSEI